MPDGNTEPDDPDQAGDNTIGDFASCRVGGEPQAQAALDDGEGQDDAAPPHVRSRPNRSPSLSDVDGVVECAKDRLEHEGRDDGKTNDGMVLVDLCVSELASCNDPRLSMRWRMMNTCDGSPSFVGALATYTPKPKPARAIA